MPDEITSSPRRPAAAYGRVGIVARFLAERLKEPSTLRGWAMLTGAFGAAIRPELAAAILACAAGISGLIGVLMPDAPG
jgi:hypothetical protein